MKILMLALPLLLVPTAQQHQADPQPITGQVVDVGGAPIPGARYRISGYEELSNGEWSLVFYTGEQRVLTTDAEGRFSVTPRPDQRLDLDFDADGMAPSFLTEVEAGADLKVVLREGLDVAGRVVLDSGAGVQGFDVGLQRPNGRGAWFQITAWTDADGRFEFPAFREDGQGWQLTVGRASLPLEAKPGEVLDDLLVEIKLSRTGR